MRQCSINLPVLRSPGHPPPRVLRQANLPPSRRYQHEALLTSPWTASSRASMDSKLKGEPRQGTRTPRLARLRDREDRSDYLNEQTALPHGIEQAPQRDDGQLRPARLQDRSQQAVPLHFGVELAKTSHSKPLRCTASSWLLSSRFRRSLHSLVVSSRPNQRAGLWPSSMKACGASKPDQASSCTTSSIAWAATELRAYRPEVIKTVLPTDISGSRPPSRSTPGVMVDGAARHAGQRTGRHATRPHRPVPAARRRPTARSTGGLSEYN